MAAWTFSAVLRATAGSSLTTRETVFALTPARRETSRIVGRSDTGAQVLLGTGGAGQPRGQLPRPRRIDAAGQFLLDRRGRTRHRELDRRSRRQTRLERL